MQYTSPVAHSHKKRGFGCLGKLFHSDLCEIDFYMLKFHSNANSAIARGLVRRMKPIKTFNYHIHLCEAIKLSCLL